MISFGNFLTIKKAKLRLGKRRRQRSLPTKDDLTVEIEEIYHDVDKEVRGEEES